MVTVTVTWSAFGGNAELEFALPISSFDTEMDLSICESIFSETNRYSGAVWTQKIEPNLPENRSHTALSVGDKVAVDGRVYLCEDFGFKLIEKVEAE